jgi:hypothetical protein
MFDFVSVKDLKPNQFIAHETPDGREVKSRVLSVDVDGDTVFIKHAWSKGNAVPYDSTDCVVVVG